MSLADMPQRVSSIRKGSGQSGTGIRRRRRSGGTAQSVVYAADGSVISRLNDQGASYYLKRDEIPQPVIDAVVCMEDQRFYQHRGVDFQSACARGKITA